MAAQRSADATPVEPIRRLTAPVTIRALLCESQALLREALVLILKGQHDIEVVGEAGSIAEAAALAARLRPHVALLADCDGDLEVVAAIRAIRSRSPETAILIRTSASSAEVPYHAVNAGASGYLLGDARSEQLIDAVRATAGGGAYLSPPLTRKLIDDVLAYGLDPGGERLDELTEQERQVLRLLARGHSNAELGTALYLSESTIKTHLSHIFRKLGVRDRVQAVIAAYDARLIQPGASDENKNAPPVSGQRHLAVLGDRSRATT